MKIGEIQHRLVPATELSKSYGLQGSGSEGPRSFEDARSAAGQTPLLEIAPSALADAPAALGFALAWMKAASKNGLMIWSVPEHSFSEYGAPYAEGLAQFGLDPRSLLLVRTKNQLDALWAAEQALTLPSAHLLCTIAHSPKSLSLAASRRLLLNAEKSGACCVLLRFDMLAPSAARSRWRIAAATSHAEDHGFGARELGAPSFNVQLERNRASPAGQIWRVDWNAHGYSFQERLSYATKLGADPSKAANDRTLDSAVLSAPFHRSSSLQRRRAN